jgi:hypothetical protein
MKYFPHVPPSHCAECKAECQVTIAGQHYGVTIVPDTMFLGPPGGGLLAVIFGALVSDILTFRKCISNPGHKLLRHRPGPLKISLYVRVPRSPSLIPLILSRLQRAQIVGTPMVEDELYASCAHRDITTFSLAWWLATHFRLLVEKHRGGSIEGLELLSLYSPDGEKWTASARYGPKP